AGQPIDLPVVEAHDYLAAHHADGRRDGALTPYYILDLFGDSQVLGPRQAVGDERAFQGDHRGARAHRGRDLVTEPDGVSDHDRHHTTATIRPTRPTGLLGRRPRHLAD